MAFKVTQWCEVCGKVIPNKENCVLLQLSLKPPVPVRIQKVVDTWGSNQTLVCEKCVGKLKITFENVFPYKTQPKSSWTQKSLL